MTRRIKKDLREFFINQALTDAEKAFIFSCMNRQQEYPQLTSNQWRVVTEIALRYGYTFKK